MRSTHPAALRHTGVLLASLALAQMLIGIDYNIVFVALPQIQQLGFSDAALQWVISSYAIGFGGFLLLGGRLVDYLGRRRMFLVGAALYAVGSVIGGLAANETLLIAGRAIQGLGGATLAPATLALIGATFAEGRERNRALGIWGAAGSAGMVLGSILGGVLTEVWGWRAVFLVNLPLAAVVIGLALTSVPRDAEPSRQRLDLPGAVLTTASAVLAVLGLTLAAQDGWASAATIGTLAAFVLAVIVLLLVERRTARPIFDLRRFTDPFLATGTASTFLFMAGFGASAYFLTLYLQNVRGLSAMQTGLAFVVPCVAVLIGTQLGGRLATGSLRRAMLVGQGVGLAGTLALALLLSGAIDWLTLLALAFVFSLGQGITFTAMFATASTGAADDEQGTVGGIATTGQQLGGAIGLAVLVSLTASTPHPAAVGFGGISAIIAIGILVALRIPAQR